MEPVPEPVGKPDPGFNPSGRSGDVAGRISYVGETQFEERRTGWLVLLSIVLAIGTVAFTTRLLLTTLLPYVVIAVLLFMLLQWATRGVFGRMLGGAGRFAAFSRSAAPRRERGMVPVQPFRVASQDGREVQCSIAGHLGGGSLSLGDQVVVAGRFDRRSGVFVASEVLNTTTGASTRAQAAAMGRANRVAMWVLPFALAWAFVAIMQAARTIR